MNFNIGKLCVRSKAALLLLGTILTLGLQAQTVIKGKVTDSRGAPVPGASVQIKNAGNGTASNNEGVYQFTVNLKPGKHEVVISSVGFSSSEKSITVKSNNESFTIDASLKDDATGLDEVVVTGTSQGTTKKQLGNFIGTIKGSQIANSGSSNAIASLQGKVAGAQITQNSGDPAGGMSVKLRGVSSISGSSDPLYIVDGVIINNSNARVTNASADYDAVGSVGQNRMVDINPNDIDRIEVLNGAAAAAIYGSRANAGVVQIFTKRGSSGAPKVTFSSKVNSNSLRKRLEVNRSPVKFGGPTDGPGALTQDVITAPFQTTTTPVTRYDYQDDIFRTGYGTDNNISITGGQDKTRYFASLNYNTNQGIIKGTDNTRFGFRLNIDNNLTKWLSWNAGINYINNATNEKPDGNTFFSPINAITIIGNFHNIGVRDANGNLQAVGERGRVNPLTVMNDIKQRNVTNRTISNVGFKLYPFKGMVIDYTAGLDNITQNGTTYIPPFTYNASPGFYGGGLTLDPTQNGYASAATFNSTFFNHDLNFTYSTQIIDKLSSVTQFGYSEQYEKSQYILTQSRGLLPGISTANGGSTLLPSADGRSERSVRGFFLQQNFKFNNQFFVTAAGRIDGSSVFDKSNRNFFYPKVSGNYLISESEYFKKSSLAKYVNTFKIRAAYGESGNLTGIGAYDRFNIYNVSPFLGRTSLTSPSTTISSNLKPERQKELEIGTDIVMLDNRLQFTFNYYNKQVSDLLVPNITNAPSSGFPTASKNVGTLSNKGFEVLITAVPIKTKDFKWEIIGNFNKNKNRIESLGVPFISFSTGTGAVFALVPGYDAPIFYSTFFATGSNGNQLLNASGIPVTARGPIANGQPFGTPTVDPATGLPFTSGANSTILRGNLGSPNPTYTATLINSFTYKKWSFGFQLDRVAGAEVFNADFRTRQGVGNGTEAQKEQTGVLPRGYISGIYGIEEWRVDDGSFTKLRELSVGYNFGKVNKAFSNLTISFSGRNLISWDKYRGYDPETNATGQNSLLRGVDFGNVPIPKTFQLGVVANF
ncbi:MAG: SusC/RagA family TonB-linked outer membrane protein [Sediminibacterium sp.]|nr:SusC/RagA family TonB-linked outer membrane protein [Sediminibacterium sp.]